MIRKLNKMTWLVGCFIGICELCAWLLGIARITTFIFIVSLSAASTVQLGD